MLGIDIGGTKIAAGVVQNGKVTHRIVIPTENAAIISELRYLVLRSKGTVGIGVPGAFHNSQILNLPHLPALSNIDLTKALGRKVILENDARCFVLAEHKYGAAKGCGSVVGVTLGTGVGGGIISDGKLVRGRGAAGEFGKILYGDGTFEDALSGPGILLKHQQSGGKEMTLKEIWASKTRIAAKTRADASLALAQLAEHIVVTLDPDIIVIGGGVTNYDIIAPAKRIYKSPLVKSKLGVDAGIIGATIAADF